MDLTNEQRQAVRQWIADGAGLSDVQKRIKDEFGLGMTYMDVRFLVLDLGAKVKDKPEPRQRAPDAAAAADEEALDEAGEEEEPIPFGAAPDKPTGGAKVAVTLDRVVRAGAVVSGEATFSDGTRAKWFIDQLGRLGLDAAKTGYRPPAADLQEFQTQLRSLLQTRGY